MNNESLRASFRALIFVGLAVAVSACKDGWTPPLGTTAAIAYGTVTIDSTPIQSGVSVTLQSLLSDCETRGLAAGSGRTNSNGEFRAYVSGHEPTRPICVRATVKLPSGDSLTSTRTVHFRNSEPYDSVRIDISNSP